MILQKCMVINQTVAWVYQYYYLEHFLSNVVKKAEMYQRYFYDATERVLVNCLTIVRLLSKPQNEKKDRYLLEIREKRYNQYVENQYKPILIHLLFSAEYSQILNHF